MDVKNNFWQFHHFLKAFCKLPPAEGNEIVSGWGCEIQSALLCFRGAEPQSALKVQLDHYQGQALLKLTET